MAVLESELASKLVQIGAGLRRSRVVRYSTAVVLAGMALVLTPLVPHVNRDPFFSFFMVAVALTALLSGRGPGLVAVGLSVIGAGFLLPGGDVLLLHDRSDLARFSMFAGAAALIVWLISALQSARETVQGSQRELRESEARLRTLAESIPQLVWSTTAEGTVEYLSQQWCHYTGQQFADALRAGWQQAVHPEDRERVAATWDRALASGEIFELDMRLRRADGMYRWNLARAVPLNDGKGRVVKWFGTCTDIQHGKETEEALRRAEKLAAAARLASSMAHEINNPLMSVTNLLYLLLGRTAADPQSTEYLRAAQQEMSRVVHIANQTLGLYREFSQPNSIIVANVLEHTLQTYAGKLDEGQIVVSKYYGSCPEIKGHEGDLRQLFSNLILNAVEAIEGGGKITVRLRPGSDFRDLRRGGVRIVIADNGHGIPAEHRQRIFEPFFTTKPAKGTGLGLWIVQEILERYGGSIRIRSSTRPDRSGTVLSIFLPPEAAGTTGSTSSGAAA